MKRTLIASIVIMLGLCPFESSALTINPLSDIKTMYQWGVKTAKRQYISPELKKRAKDAFLRMGVPAATVLILAAGGGATFWQFRKAFIKEKKANAGKDPVVPTISSTPTPIAPSRKTVQIEQPLAPETTPEIIKPDIIPEKIAPEQPKKTLSSDEIKTVKAQMLKAIDNNDVETIKNILNNTANKQDLLASVPDYIVVERPLHEAVKKGAIEIIKLLISHGANVNEKESFDKAPPLFDAVNQENIAIVKLLLDAKADVNARNTFKMSPLHFAVNNKNIKIAQLLIDANVDINAQNEKGYTALFDAIISKDEKMVQLLVESGAQLGILQSILDDKKNTLLHFVAKRGDNAIAQSLLKKDLLTKQNVNLNKQNSFGYTPLHLAISQNNKEMVQLLLDAGAKTNIPDLKGATPIHWAKHFNNPEIKALLNVN